MTENCKQCKQGLQNQIPLSYMNSKKRQCLYTDASKIFWGVISTQISVEDVEICGGQQHHEPLIFTGDESNTKHSIMFFNGHLENIFAVYEIIHVLESRTKPFSRACTHSTAMASSIMLKLSSETVKKLSVQ